MAVNGVQSLMRKFNQLGSMEPIVYKSVKRQAEVVRGVAVKLCPVYYPKGDPIPGVSSGELRNSIFTKVEQDADATIGCVYTNKEYAPYVEFGTGPVGEANHAGISPNVPVAYRQDGWVWQDEEGGFHSTEGQPAQPFMYPALKSMEKHVIKAIGNDLQAAMREVGGNQ